MARPSCRFRHRFLDKFTNIEVSVQNVGEPYLFSGKSVLRGSYR